MSAFRTPVDLCNRALQLLRQPAIYSFADNTVQSIEVARAYDSLRVAELRRALWRFSTRRVILRAITSTSRIVVPPAWSNANDYLFGDLVSYDNLPWSAIADNIADDPNQTPGSVPPFWDTYFGPLIADVYDDGTIYFTGELVFKTPGDGDYTVYRSLVNNNDADPEGVDDWDSAIVYQTGQVVVFDETNYQSITDLNFGNSPDVSPANWDTTITSPLVSNSWREITDATLTPTNIIYPLGAGPATDTATRNIFRLPSGFVRQAPTDPKADLYPFLGAPSYNLEPDWIFESNYIVSRSNDPIMLRFVADIQTVTEFDPLFAVGLSTRIAIELAPRLADGEHLATIIAESREEYARTISEARTINAIETGPTSPYEDEYLAVRL